MDSGLHNAAIFKDCLEDPPYPEEEPPAAIVAHRTCKFDRPEYRIHDNPSCPIHGEIWWTRTLRELVGLAHLVQPENIDRATQERRQCRHLSDIPKLSQEILIREQFVRTPGDEALRSTRENAGMPVL